MPIIKKKDLKKFKVDDEKEEIDELVDSDGSPIEGAHNDENNDSEIFVAPQQTTDDFANSGIQPNRFFYGVGGMGYVGGYRGSQVESVEEMRKIIEDKLANRSNRTEIVNDKKISDINKNEIPDIEELSDDMKNPLASRHTQMFVYDINKGELNGEQTGIILNYIMDNLNLSDIPPVYKNILNKKLNG